MILYYPSCCFRWRVQVFESLASQFPCLEVVPRQRALSKTLHKSIPTKLFNETGFPQPSKPYKL